MFVYRGEYYKEREKPGEENLEAMTKWQQDMEQLHGKAEVIHRQSSATAPWAPSS